MKEDFLSHKLNVRKEQQMLRKLSIAEGKIDFCSNDYLGIIKNGLLETVDSDRDVPHGSGGSRLLSGNYALIEEVEKQIASFHKSSAALIYNSGYDANLGFFSCVPQRGDTILYDALSHASIRDGIRLGFASAHAFGHNDIQDLAVKLASSSGRVFVVTESVFSMDGHVAPLEEIVKLCKEHHAYLVIDEAHATGIIGAHGEGLVQQLGLQDFCFARIHTFGKAVGCHGAAILGSDTMRNYLINFSRPFIYSTGMPPVSANAIGHAYALFPTMKDARRNMLLLIDFFTKETMGMQRIESPTAIQALLFPGNNKAMSVARYVQGFGFDVRPVFSPTVPEGTERLRIILHAFNTKQQVADLVSLLHQFLKSGHA